jgi:hypothetical protein
MMTAHRYEAPMSSAKGLRQVGYFDCPGDGQIVVAGTTARVQSNDVTTDDRGLLYLLDRLRGLIILECC